MADEFVTISRAELESLRAVVAESNRSSLDPEDRPVPRSELTRALQTRDSDHSRELQALEQRSSELERSYKAALRDRELATALAGKPLVPGASRQLIQLWREDFEVIDDEGSVRVLARDGRSVEQAVDSRLAGPEFAHFCLPTSRGGTGSKGQNRSADPVSKPSGPKNLGEAVLVQWREATSRPQASSAPAGWGRRR